MFCRLKRIDEDDERADTALLESESEVSYLPDFVTAHNAMLELRQNRSRRKHFEIMYKNTRFISKVFQMVKDVNKHEEKFGELGRVSGSRDEKGIILTITITDNEGKSTTHSLFVREELFTKENLILNVAVKRGGENICYVSENVSRDHGIMAMDIDFKQVLSGELGVQHWDIPLVAGDINIRNVCSGGGQSMCTIPYHLRV